MPRNKRSWLYLSLSVTAPLFSGCQTVPNTTGCTIAGKLLAGMICAETNTDKTSELDFDQTIDFLEPQVERPDPKDPTKTLPARGGAVCFSAEDTNKMKTFIEKACRQLGNKCTYETSK